MWLERKKIEKHAHFGQNEFIDETCGPTLGLPFHQNLDSNTLIQKSYGLQSERGCNINNQLKLNSMPMTLQDVPGKMNTIGPCPRPDEKNCEMSQAKWRIGARVPDQFHCPNFSMSRKSWRCPGKKKKCPRVRASCPKSEKKCPKTPLRVPEWDTNDGPYQRKTCDPRLVEVAPKFLGGPPAASGTFWQKNF